MSLSQSIGQQLRQIEQRHMNDNLSTPLSDTEYVDALLNQLTNDISAPELFFWRFDRCNDFTYYFRYNECAADLSAKFMYNYSHSIHDKNYIYRLVIALQINKYKYPNAHKYINDPKYASLSGFDNVYGSLLNSIDRINNAIVTECTARGLQCTIEPATTPQRYRNTIVITFVGEEPTTTATTTTI